MAGRTLQVTSKLPHHHQAYNYVTIIKNICASHTAPLVPRCPQENQPSHVEGWADETAYWIQANSHRLHSNSILVRESVSSQVFALFSQSSPS